VVIVPMAIFEAPCDSEGIVLAYESDQVLVWGEIHLMPLSEEELADLMYLFSGLRAGGEVGESWASAAEQVGEHAAEVAALLSGGLIDAGQAGVGDGPAFGSAAA